MVAGAGDWASETTACTVSPQVPPSFGQHASLHLPVVMQLAARYFHCIIMCCPCAPFVRDLCRLDCQPVLKRAAPMTDPLQLPKFSSGLPDFVADLRSLVFSSQSKAARYFGVTHSTISRYEGGRLLPQAGYLFTLASLLADRLDSTPTSSRVREHLLDELNTVLRLCYPDEALLENWEALQQARLFREETAADNKQAATSTLSRIDWGEAPAVHRFYGREPELEIMARWVIRDGCRLVSVLGLGGVGKTTLVTRVTETVQKQFEFIIWRSLHNGTLPADLVRECLQLMPDQQADQAEPQITHLLRWLSRYRCLLVLDNFETVLQEGERAGRYRPGFESYGELLRSIGEARHQSCLLLTSREKPAEVAMLDGHNTVVRSLQLRGLSPEKGAQILADKNVNGPLDLCAELVDRYSGNPLALKFVAETINELFGGDVAAFLQSEATIWGDVRQLLDHQFERLTPIELEVMYWLAIERESVELNVILENSVAIESRRMLVEAMGSLRRRSLIEKSDPGFTLQNVVLEYTTDRLVSQASAEIQQERIHLLQRHPLVKAQAREYIRQAQKQLILQPMTQRLVSVLGEAGLEVLLKRLLATVHPEHGRQPGYAGGNILNLLLNLGVDLRGYDFSGMAVWQACLQRANLPDVNFAGADLTRSAFADSFTGVSAVALSGDGRLLATGGDETVQLWYAEAGQPYRTLAGHTNMLLTVAFSPDSRRLASAGADQAICLWDVDNGQLFNVLHGHTNWVWQVDFSTDGRLLASGGQDGTVRLWDINNGWQLACFEQPAPVLAVAFSPDSRLLVAGREDGSINLFDVESRQSVGTLAGHSTVVSAVAFNPTGDLLASGGHDHLIRLWDMDSRKLQAELRGHTDRVSGVAIGADGLLVSSSYDQTIRVWDIETGRVRRILHGHERAAATMAYCPTAQLLASGGYDLTVRLWSLKGGRLLRTLYGHTQGVQAVAFNPDGMLLASGGKDYVARIWDVASGQLQQIISGHRRWIAAVAFSPDGRHLATASYDRTVRLWNVSTGHPLPAMHRHEHWVLFTAFNAAGSLLVSGGVDTEVHLWEAGTGRVRHVLAGHQRPVSCGDFSPKGNLLATGSEDQTIRLWDVTTGQAGRTLRGHDAPVTSLAFNPQGDLLASSSDDGRVHLWDVAAGEIIRTLDRFDDSVACVVFGPDGRTLATGSNDHTIRLWDTATGQAGRVLAGHLRAVSWLTFAPSGKLLASASQDGTVRVWQVATGTCLHTLRSERPYEGMIISGATGLTQAQRVLLLALGAVER
jgi:WD40 repeat protein/transcriptional regulator with XRE-family HTH domain